MMHEKKKWYYALTMWLVYFCLERLWQNNTGLKYIKCFFYLNIFTIFATGKPV